MTSTSFAEAQRRVLERQAQRDAESRVQQAQFRPGAPTSLFSRLSTSSAPAFSQIVSREGTRPPFRVSQVDAELLDEELLVLLKSQVGEALKYYSTSWREDYASEILLALRAILFKLSIWDHDSSYGATLQGLKYVDARSSAIVPPSPSRLQKASYGILTVFGRYAWEKWEAYLLSQSTSDDYYYNSSPTPQTRRLEILSRITSIASSTHSIAAFTSFLIFLVNGRYRTLTDRLLRLRLTPSSSQISREVSFEYLNRQLVWHAFTEFLLFLLPLVGIGRWRRWISRAWRRAKLSLQKATEDPNAIDSTEALMKEEKNGPLSYLPERICAICYADQNPESTSEAELLGVNTSAGGGTSGVIGSATTDIVNPYETVPCGCIYCFVCLATKIEAEEGEGWTCLRCGEIVKQCKPWNGDVITTMPNSTTAVASSDQKEPIEDAKAPIESDLESMEPKPEESSMQSSSITTEWSELNENESDENNRDQKFDS